MPDQAENVRQFAPKDPADVAARSLSMLIAETESLRRELHGMTEQRDHYRDLCGKLRLAFDAAAPGLVEAARVLNSSALPLMASRVS
jgi:hypothetical protein